jgi:DNA-directed RNA polymerase omega subunit
MSTHKEFVNSGNGLNADLSKLDSIYRLIIVAGLRSKQLVRGSHPRIVANPLKRKNTSIALEEVRQGLVPFKIRESVVTAEAQDHNGGPSKTAITR